MRFTNSFIYTLKENPKEATSLSHSLLIKASYIYQHAAGIYNFLPLGFKVLSKIWKIIEEEMDKIGAQELLMPALQTSHLWIQTNRYYTMDNILFKLKDKKGTDMLLGPTHEEIITDIVSHFVKSYKNLPLLLYQIQVKFRDELRPKGGLIRAREFIMKDLYSFHSSLECLDKTYNDVYKAYSRIFERLNIPFEVIEAHSGAIGGDVSHEFMLITESGEDKFIKCLTCNYSASTEIAKINKPDFSYSYIPIKQLQERHLVHTPNCSTIENLVKLLNKKEKDFVKSILYKDSENNFYLVLVRGDKEVNEIKLSKYLNKDVFIADEKDFEKNGWVLGFIGPINLNNRHKVKIIADYSVVNLKDMIIGANIKDYHFVNVNFENLEIDEFGDISYAIDNDECYKCKGKYKIYPALELGHIFKLGTKYSESLNAYFMDENNKLNPIIMGCYGIGVSRLISAIVEAYSTPNCITWTFNSTPYKIYLLTINSDDKEQFENSLKIYNSLNNKLNGSEVLWDDRKESAGVKFKDWELLGIPIAIIIGNKIKDNLVEIKFNPNFPKTLPQEIFQKIESYQNSLIKINELTETIESILNYLDSSINKKYNPDFTSSINI